MSDFFQAAYERARARFTEEQWLTLLPSEMTEAIYNEMRLLDAEAARAAEPDGHAAGSTA